MSATPTGGRTKWRARAAELAGHPVFLVAVGIATIVGGLSAAVGLFDRPPGSESDTSVTSEEEPGDAREEPAEPDVRTDEAAGVVQPGACIAADDGGVVPCDTAHAYEVFSVTDCSEAALTRYLGGEPGVERLRVQPRELRVGGEAACVVDDPTADRTVGTVQGILQDGDVHSAWRVCVDARLGGAEVACSEEHTGEVIVPSPQAARPVDCMEVTAAYTGVRSRDLASTLQVVEMQYPEGTRCLVQVRGASLLDASLRNIGTRSLPLVQG